MTEMVIIDELNISFEKELMNNQNNTFTTVNYDNDFFQEINQNQNKINKKNKQQTTCMDIELLENQIQLIFQRDFNADNYKSQLFDNSKNSLQISQSRMKLEAILLNQTNQFPEYTFYQNSINNENEQRTCVDMDLIQDILDRIEDDQAQNRSNFLLEDF